MNIALVSLRSPFLDNDRVYPPLAPLYLKRFAESNIAGLNIDLLDDYSIEDFEPYDYIGISVMTPQRVEADRLVRELKERYPKKKIVLGGPHVKHYLEDLVMSPADFLVPGDGEIPFSNIIVNDDGPRIFIEDLTRSQIAELSIPDRSSEKAIRYLKGYSYDLQGRPATTMLTSRGCCERCSFCEDASSRIRYSGLDNIIEELNDIVNLGFQGVYIFDDLFAMNRHRLGPVAIELYRRDLIYRCNGQARHFTHDETIANMLGNTGCVEIAFGFESGSQKILDTINKRTTTAQNYRSVELAKRAGMKVKGFMMIGLPGETYHTLKETEDFIRDSGMDDFQLSIFFPYKGTEIRASLERGDDIDMILEKEGIGAYGQKGGNTEASVRTQCLTSGELLKIRDAIVRKYRPSSHRVKWDGR